jgi:large subunit ribosomal protein L21
MFMYAILEAGGKQYRVRPGELVVVDKLPQAAGEPCVFERVLLVSGDDGQVQVGTPVVQGAKALGCVVEQVRGPKIIGFKYKPKTNYRRRFGHRQELSCVRIEEIQIQ